MFRVLVLLLSLASGNACLAFAYAAPATLALSGKVTAGNLPVYGASVQVYAMAIQSGSGTGSVPLLTQPVKSGTDGSYNVSFAFACPYAQSPVYLLATGGQNALSPVRENKASVLVSYAGDCSELTGQKSVQINEATTVGFLWPVSSFVASATTIGAFSSQLNKLAAATEIVKQLIDPATGSSPGTTLSAGAIAPSDKLYMLGAILASCVLSQGGVAGDGSPCGQLFSITAYGGTAVPTDTFQAALAIARHPFVSVLSLFELMPRSILAQSTIVRTPTGWNLSILPALPAPQFSELGVVYETTQTLSIADSVPEASMFYTTDGSAPTALSTLYTGPLIVSKTATVRALAVLHSVSSPGISVTLTIHPKITISPQSAILGPTDVMPFTAAVDGRSLGNTIWKVSPNVGSITSAGLYLAPMAVAATQPVTITAADPNTGSMASVTVIVQNTGTTLRSAAAARGLLVGAAADADEFGQASPIVNNFTYAKTLATQFNLLEPENAMKWAVIAAQPGTYNFEPADTLVNFARQNRMAVRGHTLCWWQQNPAWMSALSSSQLSQVLHDYIFAVMGRYKGEVFAWDVVNEAIGNDATENDLKLNYGLWNKAPGIGLTGTGYIEQAFRWAREADPGAKLFYNDHDIEVVGAKQKALLTMLRDFQSRGVPIDGVGLEMHIDPKNAFPSTFAEALQSYTDLGLEVHITEMDVRLPVDAGGTPSAADLQTQANTFKSVVSTCLQNTRCTVIQTWGFSDAWSWIPRTFVGYGSALPYDRNYAPKAAYSSLLQSLQSR